MRRVLASICLACLAVMAMPGSWSALAAPVVVTDVRVGENAAGTRFVLDLDSKVSFRIFMLADPYRVVIDLPEVGWRLPAQPLPRNTGLLNKFRYGLFKEGTSRVVLDMRGPVAVRKAFLLEPAAGYRYRLVLDLVGVSRAAFLKSVGDAGLEVAAGPPVTAKPGARPKKPVPTAAPERVSVSAAVFPLPLRKPRRTEEKRMVVIDPGHGGVDPGTVGVSGVYEKHITLAVAQEIKRQLNKTGRFHAVLTRERDIFIRLRDRVSFAREKDADLFVSIHADAIKNRRVRGLSVYTLSEKASDSEAAALADKENKADLIAGIDLTRETPEVTNILIDLAQRESMNRSVGFASGLVRELARETRILRNSHRFAGFAVLKAPDVPSVLLELGFLSNSQDEAALRRKTYRTRLAKAVTRAVDGYFARVEEAARK